MSNRNRPWKAVVFVGALLFVVATGIKLLLNLEEISQDQKGHYGPSDSAAEAEQKGTLLCKVSISPQKLIWKGQEIEFKEAWLEERVRLHFPWVWFRRYHRLGDFHLCFVLNEGNEVFRTVDAPFFVLDDEKAGVGSLHGHGRVIFYAIVDRPDFSSIRMSLVSSLRDRRRNTITLTR